MTQHAEWTVARRARAADLFEAGFGADAAATELGMRPATVRSFRHRWRIWGREVLMPTTGRQTYSVELKLEVVHRFLAGETKISLAQAFGLSSPKLVGVWVRTYRTEGAAGLRPKPAGRPKRDREPETELERLRRENEYLRAEVAYLGKLRALSATERR